jgi:hypothetical protein
MLHVMLLIVVGGCLAAFWWQLHRALHGHTQSWAYTVEWPAFAAYAGWMWWKLLHEEREFAGPDGRSAGEGPGAPEPSEDPAAAEEAEHRAWVAYNEYLARLSEANRQRRR